MSASSRSDNAAGQFLLRVDEAALFLGLSSRETYRLAQLPEGRPGALPPGIVVRLGRRVRFSRLRLLALLGENLK